MSYNNQYDETVSVGDWLGSLFLTLIPVVGIVLVFVWAFGSSTKPSKRNFFRAYLIYALIFFVIGIGVTIAFWGIIAAGFGGLSGFYS